MTSLKHIVREGYFGRSQSARVFRVTLFAFDLATLAYFVAATFLAESPDGFFALMRYAIAAIIALDLAARFWIAPRKAAFLTHLTTITDLVVLLSLLLQSLFTDNLAFLRLLRVVGLVRSFSVIRDFRRESRFVRRHEELLQSALNLVAFIFVTAALVYVLQEHTPDSEISNFVDALYFTVSTLTTTGYGDITLVGSEGRLLSVVIMVVGVSLFLRLLQTIFRPTKVQVTCDDCGLMRHDADANHCKHCGKVVFIPDDGD